MVLRVTQTALVDALFQQHVSADEIREWLAHIGKLLERQQPFFFIASTQPNTTFARDYRTIQGFWYRQHKAAFQIYCRGLVRIANDEADRVRLDAPALHRTWGIPYFVTRQREQGYQWVADRLLELKP